MNLGIDLDHSPARGVTRRLLWAGLALLLIVNVPCFLCMRLNGDATYYDLQVQCLEEGGVLYRDLLEPNLPGAVWIHRAVRAVGGWSTVSLRIFDVTVLAAIIMLLIAQTCRKRASTLVAPSLGLSVAWFYLSLSTWSHCQRDTWMLLPALGAVSLRAWVVWRIASGYGAGWSIVVSLAEGLLWATAFWIKPHVAVPAIGVLAISMFLTGFKKSALTSVGGVLCGGLMAGMVGSGWLIATGAWPYFWEMQLEWNPEYLASRAQWDWGERYIGLFRSFSPWCWAHLVAVPLATATVFSVLTSGRGLVGSGEVNESDRHAVPEVLLSALYLGWLIQSMGLQHPFSYTHVPGVILALAIVCRARWPVRYATPVRAIAAAVFVVAVLLSPCTKPIRFAAWWNCVTSGPTLENRALFQARPGPYWVYYPELIEFLANRDVRDKDVLVYSSALVPLYRDLELRPPNRFALTDVHRVFFQDRVPLIREAIADSDHKYIVSDMSGLGLRLQDLEQIDPRTGLPVALPDSARLRFPVTQPVVFRSGWFFVHEARNVDGL